MIVTQLNQIKQYENAHPRFKKAFEALCELAEKNVADGKYEIDGKNIFAIVSTLTTKPTNESKFEMHKDYIDIQFILEGSEIMGHETTDKLVAIGEYTPDAQLFKINKEFDKIKLSSGELAIFFAEEAHAPSIAVNELEATVKKIIVKVLK